MTGLSDGMVGRVIGFRAGHRAQALIVIYVAYALLTTAFLVMGMPPFQNPDETNHLLRADNISRGYLVGHHFGTGDSGGIASPAIERSGRPFDWPKMVADRKVTVTMYVDALAHFGEPGRDITFSNTSIYPPWFYAPSVVAVRIGRAGRMTVLQTLYLARLLTALASCALLTAALVICCNAGASGAALMIFTVATLPMTMSLQNSVSQDGVLFGVLAVAAALLARMRMMPGDARGFAVLCLCLALAASARPPYVFLALLVLVTPVGWSARLWGTACIVLTCGLWTALASHAAGIEAAGRGGTMADQVSHMRDPVWDLFVASNTLRDAGWNYMTEMVGQLGWLDVWLPRWLIDAALGVFALAALAAMDLRGRSALIVAAALLLSVGSVFGAIYLTWSPVGATWVQGVQGRYFLPLLVLLAAIGTTLARSPLGMVAYAVSVAFPLVSLGVTMRAIVVRYYLTL